MTENEKPYGERAARHAAELTVRTDATLEASIGTPVPVAPIGSVLVVLLGLWLWSSKPLLHIPYTGAGWDTALRDEGIAALLLLAGLVLWRLPRNTPAVVVAVLGGLALIAFGVWANHGVQRTAVNEILTGVAVIGAALTAKVHR